MIRRIVDAVMSVLLLCLMAYQVTGEVLHEWIGTGMTILVVIHQILNRKWYSALFKCKYTAYRVLTAAISTDTQEYKIIVDNIFTLFYNIDENGRTTSASVF